jgi:hypothetical protein
MIKSTHELRAYLSHRSWNGRFGTGYGISFLMHLSNKVCLFFWSFNDECRHNLTAFRCGLGRVLASM